MTLFEMFYLDTRSLAVFRIGLGLTILYHLATLVPNMDAFFGPHSIYPLILFQHDPHPLWHWSLHALSDAPWFVLTLFVFNALLAVMLLIGLQTQMVAFLCWLLAVSLTHRDPIAMGVGRDYALIMCLMWGTLLPLGEQYSIDALMRKSPYPAKRIYSWVSAGFIGSLTMAYLISGWCKISPLWTESRMAIAFAFNNPVLVKPLGQWLLQFPAFLQALSWLTVLLERGLILWLMVPFKPSWGRSFLIVAFSLLHLGMFLTLRIEWFALIMITAWTALIPSCWWERGRKTAAARQPFWMNLTGFSLLVFACAWHYWTVQEFFHHRPRPAVLNIAQIAGLNFAWELFSPGPPPLWRRCDTRPVFEGPFSIPAKVSKKDFWQRYQFFEDKDIRWQYAVAERENSSLLPFLKDYLVYFWNTTYPAEKAAGAIINCWDEKIYLRSPNLNESPAVH